MPLRKTAVQVGALQALAALLTLLPLWFFNTAAFAGNTDALFYTIMLKLTAQHMAQGQFLPVWLPEANGGIGSPAMHFYSLLAYQITALLGAPIATFDPLGWKRLALGMFFAQWFAGMGAWAWLSRHVRPRPAIIASLLFTLFPYKWLYIYLHINLAQLWALVWLPPLMMAAEDVSQHKRRAIVWYGVWLALVALTHPHTLIAFSPVPALYVLVFAGKERARTLLPLAAAHALAGVLAAFYLLPAMLNLGLLQASTFSSGRFNYAGNLNHHDLVLNFHYAIIAALIIGLAVRTPALQRPPAQKHMIFWLAMLVVVIFMCTKLSLPLWDHIGVLQLLQFPVARFNAVALMAACMLSALFMEHYRRVPELPRIYSPAVLMATVAVMSVINFMYVQKIYSTATDINWKYIEKIHALNLILPREYLTKWQPQDANSLDNNERNAALPLAAVMQGKGTASAAFDAHGAVAVTAHVTSGDMLLRIRQLYWPGWAARMETKVDNDGLITLRLPQGDQAVTLEQQPLPGETAGKIISLLAWVGSFLYLRFVPRHHQQA